MEQNEKTQEVPAWVKIVNDFPAPCQQSIGNLCAQAVQNLSTLGVISYPLLEAVVKEVFDCHKEFVEQFNVDDHD